MTTPPGPHPSAHAPHPADRLLQDLEATPENGRDSLVAARLHELRGNRSHRAAHLLQVLATSELPGVRPATVAVLAAALDPSTIVRCLSQLPPTRSYQIRHICGTLRWRDALTFVASVRDGRRSLGPYIGFADDVLTLGFLLASDTHLPYGHDDISLHRSAGPETLFLFGASRAPGELLRVLEQHRILTWPQPNYDEDLSRWALANPALAGRARYHVLTQNSPQVIAALRHDGLLGLSDVVSWLRNGTAQEVLDRSVAVLHLPEDLPGSTALKASTLALLGDLAELTPRLSESARRSLSRSLSSDPAVAEIVEGLLPEWRSGVRDLLAAARSLRGDAPRTRRR